MIRSFTLLLALGPVVCPGQAPVACFPFTAGDAGDATGNGHDGFVSGALLSADRFTSPNSAYWFDGLNDRVELPALVDMVPNDEFSASLWLKAAGSNSDAVIITEPDIPSDRLCIAPHYNHTTGNTVFWDFGDIFSGGRASIIPYALSLAWDHWVFVHSAIEDRMSIYVNGVLADEEYHHSTIVDRTRPVWIGGGPASGGADFAFHGYIDDVMIYNAALSASAVAALYADQVVMAPCSQVGMNEAANTGHARFSWNGGAVVVDWPDAAQAGALSLIDASGRTVCRTTGHSGMRWVMSVSDLSPGLYTVQCNVDGRIAVGKVLAE